MYVANGRSYKARVLGTGAGGFIGHHLSKYLVERGYWVRGVDIKAPEYEATAAHEFELLDLPGRGRDSAPGVVAQARHGEGVGT